MMVILLFVFAACGNSGNDTPTTGNTNQSSQSNQQADNPPPNTSNEANANNEIEFEFWVEIDGTRYHMGQIASVFLEKFEPIGINATRGTMRDIAPLATDGVSLALIDSSGDTTIRISVRNLSNEQAMPFYDATLEGVNFSWSWASDLDIVLPFGLGSLDINSDTIKNDIIAIFGEPDSVNTTQVHEILTYGTPERHYFFTIRTDGSIYDPIWMEFGMFDRQRLN